jgi:hypothetical protein
MFDMGYAEVLVIAVFSFSGCLAALYLGLALQSSSRRRQERP